MKKSRVLFLCIWAVLVLRCAAHSHESTESETETDSTPAESASIRKNGFIFTTSRSLKTGATNELQLRRYGDLQAGHLYVTIYYQDSYTQNESIALEKYYTVQEGVDESYFELYLPRFDNYVYNGRIVINGTFGDYDISGSDKVYFSTSKDCFVVIQTDKPLYKEEQDVQFRVLCLNKDLKPCVDAKAEIWVEDPEGTRLYQWKDVDFHGLKQFTFPLAKESVKGDWKISVKIKEEVSSTNFEVKEYVLPKFGVTIEIPPYVLANAEEIKIRVCANYTYGKPVKGDLKLNVSLETYTWSTEKIPILEYEGKIDGCFEYTINVSLIEPDDYYRYRRIQIVARVEESETGMQMNETQFIQRQFSPLILSFSTDQMQYCKPGLPYIGKLIVTNPDNSPAKCERIQICVTVSRERVLGRWWATRKVKVCKNYTADENGHIGFTILPQSTDSVGITIDAISLKYVKKSTGSNRENSLSQPQTSMSLTPWYSPSGSFLQLQPVQETLFCEAQINFTFLYTSKDSAEYKFHYQVISQNEVVQSGILEHNFSAEYDVSSKFEQDKSVIKGREIQLVPPIESSRPETPEEECPSAREARYRPFVGKANIVLNVDSSWSPYFHLIVFYIRDDRETVADSQKYKVEQCFKNQVKLQFGDAVKQPGTRTSIRVSGSPNSMCGIKVVDKSVSLLNSNNQLTKEKIFSILESLDTGMYYGVNLCNEEYPQPGLPRSMASSMIFPPRPPPRWSSSSFEDTMTSFQTAGWIVISDLTLFTRPCKSSGGGGNIVYEESAGYGGFAGGQAAPVRKKVHHSKVAMASVARRPAPAAGAMSDVVGKTGVEATKSVVDVRNKFPETWLFDILEVGDIGEFTDKVTLPHTITEWLGEAFCINSEDGLGISNQTSIKGFQAFFLSFNLPYSVIRGEEFSVTISVFNYVEGALPIRIYLDEHKGFELIGDSLDSEICVLPQSSTTLKIKLKGILLGQQNLTVKAETAQDSNVCGNLMTSSALAKDGIQNSIIIEAEGWPAQDTESMLFCINDGGSFETKFIISLPDDVIPDSGRAYIAFTGNPLGQTLENLDNLVQIPTGCGEQNMVKFAPNVVAIEVLKHVKALTESRESKILKNLIIGAQRQLNFKRTDGSFSAFGMRDKEGSMFLTCMVLRFFYRANKFIPIDNSTIVNMQSWIASKQRENGCLPDIGRIIDRGIQGAMENDKSEGAITAYALASLLISGYDNKTVIDGCFTCLKNSEDKTFYFTFLYAYAQALAGMNDSAREKLAGVKDKAIIKEGTEHYHDSNATESQDIETAGYNILAVLISGGDAASVLAVIQYLAKKFNPNGGFRSTQDTCVGLEAVGEFAKLTYKDPIDMTIKCSGDIDQSGAINEEDKLLVRKFYIPKVPAEVDVLGTGTGCVLIQKIVKYNTETPPEKRSFNLEITGKCLDPNCTTATISVCVSYIPEGQTTGMSVIEIKMISNMSPIEDSLPKKGDASLQLKEVEVQINTLVLYFDTISNSEKCFSFQVKQAYPAENLQPGKTSVYDYYHSDIMSTAPYTLRSSEEN